MANPSPTTMYLNGVTVDSSLNTVQLGNFSLSAGRSTFTAVNERHAVGAKYSSIGGSVYFGAVDAVIQFNFTSAGTLSTDSSGNITSSSDERLKTIDGYFTAGLNEVLQIKPILYHWNELSQLDTENIYAGFSAQNIQSVIPLAAMANKETGYLSLQDRPIIAALVNSVKELEARIVVLEDIS